jgi:hypothetical protein
MIVLCSKKMKQEKATAKHSLQLYVLGLKTYYSLLCASVQRLLFHLERYACSSS